MKFQSWDLGNLFDKNATEVELAMVASSFLYVLVVSTACTLAHLSIKKEHINNPAKVTRSLSQDEMGYTVYHVEDKRGLFNNNYDLIIAKNQSDSAYADEKHLDLGEFSKDKVIISEHRRHGSGWSNSETMNYKLEK